MVLFVLKRYLITLNKNLLIIVPLFNESKRGATYVRELKNSIFVDNVNIDYLIIDDASTDDTFKLLNELQSESPSDFKVIKNNINLGHGNTVLKGYKYSVNNNYNFTAQIDGDNNVEPESVNKLINYSIKENLDFTLGKRIIRPDPLIRKIITFILDLNLRVRYKVKFSDTNAGIRVYSKSFLENIELDKLINLKIPNALITVFAFYLNVQSSSYPVIMRNNIREQRQGEQWGSGIGLQSKIKLIKGGVSCFIEVNTKFKKLLNNNKK